MKPMEILVINPNKNKFEWVKVNCKDVAKIENLYRNNYYAEDGHIYTQKDIYDIRNDVRKNYGYCRYCGELVRHGKEVEHGQKIKAKRPECHKCDWCKLTDTTEVLAKVEKNKDGTYTQTRKIKGTLVCRGNSYDYSSQKISLERAMAENGLCKYNNCSRPDAIVKRSGHSVLHPDAFRRVATINKLNASSKWKFKSKDNNSVTYSLGATNLMAICNTYGIIVGFSYYKRNSRTISFRYSATMDKFYRPSGNSYEETDLYELPETKRDRWMNEIRILYEV